jgi:alanine dehydrogenase
MLIAELIPTSTSEELSMGYMESGSTAGYFAIRMKSDMVYETQLDGTVTQEKYCTRPGLFCGLILLTSTPLALIDGGIGVKYLANEDAKVVGMLGTGGMARRHNAWSVVFTS